MIVLLLSRDLMLLSRTQGAANNIGATLRNATADEQASQWVIDAECCGVIIDLRTPGLRINEFVASVRKVRGPDFSVVACGPHVHEASLNAAREAGCSTVVTRGQFERDAEAIISAMQSQDS